MLLLNVLSRWANQEGKFLTVFSFDHNLREESLNEILFVEKVCKKLKCNFIKIKWHEKPKTRLMEQARVARYTHIAKKCIEKNIKTLFLGHHDRRRFAFAAPFQQILHDLKAVVRSQSSSRFQ